MLVAPVTPAVMLICHKFVKRLTMAAGVWYSSIGKGGAMDLTHKTMKRKAAERAAKVQDYKRANPEATLDEMARVFRVSRETVRTDLLKVAADVRGEGGSVLSPNK